jgi:hypothetical protein
MGLTADTTRQALYAGVDIQQAVEDARPCDTNCAANILSGSQTCRHGRRPTVVAERLATEYEAYWQQTRLRDRVNACEHRGRLASCPDRRTLTSPRCGAKFDTDEE